MQISYNWLKDFIKIAESPEEVSEILTNIGLEVEALNTVQRIPGGLEGLVVGLVESCVRWLPSCAFRGIGKALGDCPFWVSQKTLRLKSKLWHRNETFLRGL